MVDLKEFKIKEKNRIFIQQKRQFRKTETALQLFLQGNNNYFPVIFAMLAQIGYGLGLFFITPLGDKLNKKSLIVNLLVLLFLSLLLMIISSSIVQVWVLSVLIGILSVAVQVILPMRCFGENRCFTR